MTQQLPLSLKFEASLALEDFIVSDCNRFAYEQLLGSEEAPPGYGYALVGPSLSGKSHLAALWARRMGAYPLQPGDPTGVIANQKYFLIEDFDQKSYDPDLVFHALNWAKEQGGYILLTAASPPSQWSVSLPDLSSRLRSLLLLEIKEPDDLLLHMLLAKLFSDHQLSVDPSVIAYAVPRIERSFVGAYQLVSHADRRALAEKRAVTLPLIRACLAEFSEPKSDS